MDKNLKNVLVVIPARNEEKSLPIVLEDLIDNGVCNILVVDDASEDSTFEVACNFGVKTVKLPFPLGSWGALQTGLKYALTFRYPVVVSMDADGQHRAIYIKDLIKPIFNKEVDVTIGSFYDRGNVNKKFIWKLFKIFSGLDILDLTSGFRAYGEKAIKLLSSSKATLFDYQDVGVLLLLKKHGIKMKEIPVYMNKRIFGSSKIFYSNWIIFKYILETFLLILSRR